jgi:hypothetical protein
MRNRQLLPLLILIIGIVALAAFARGRVDTSVTFDTDNILFTDHYRLSSTHEGSLVVVADSVLLASDARVGGDTALVAQGSVTIDGQVNGNLTVIGEQLLVSPDAVIDGDLAFMGDKLVIDGQVDGNLTAIADAWYISETGHVSGDSLTCSTIPGQGIPDSSSTCGEGLLAQFVPLQIMTGQYDWSAAGRDIASRGLPFSLTASLILTGLSALAVTVFPRRFSHIQEAMVTLPGGVAALGCMVGLLAVGVAAGFSLLTAALPPLALILIPLGLLLTLALVVASVIGWMALALLLGTYLLVRITRVPQPPMMAVMVGSLALFALWFILALLPFGWMVGGLAMAALGCAALGASLATRLGARPLRQRYFVQG